jgi:hypothetical protein
MNIGLYMGVVLNGTEKGIMNIHIQAAIDRAE